MDARFAFTAQYWGSGAVVCRAIEERPGPVVEQQFGEFHTWTQAQNCATKLNEGLDLDPLDVRQIVTSSFLATASVIQEALDSSHAWTGSKIERDTRAAQLQFILSQLSFAVTLCRTVSLLSEAAQLRALENVRNAIHLTNRSLPLFDGDYEQMEKVACGAQALQSALQPPRESHARLEPLLMTYINEITTEARDVSDKACALN